MKLRRQRLILEIIDEKPITTQSQLAEELLERGIKTTQATISRDIKELHLIKVPFGPESYRYARPQQMDPPQSFERMRRLFRENVVKHDFSENLILIKTLPGAAHNVALPAMPTMRTVPLAGRLTRGDRELFPCHLL
jgi:transcriptional regulator of arginine metabolism